MMDDYKKNCDNCEFDAVNEEEPPCNSCTRNLAKCFCDQWEEKEEEENE